MVCQEKYIISYYRKEYHLLELRQYSETFKKQVTLKQTQQAQMVVMDYAYGKMIDLKIYNHGQKVTTRHGQVLLHN